MNNNYNTTSKEYTFFLSNIRNIINVINLNILNLEYQIINKCRKYFSKILYSLYNSVNLK